MDRITSIIFDLDGTLYESRELADEILRVSVDALALQLGVAAAEAESRTGFESTLSAACELLGGDIKALHGYLAEKVNPETYLQRDQRVVELLKRLGKDYDLYIYTNNNRNLTDRIMRLLGIEDCFREVFCVEDFWRAKPDRLALAKLLAAIGAEPVECLFVGDRYDVDLRLPEEHGSRVFLTMTVEQLLSLDELCKKGEFKND